MSAQKSLLKLSFSRKYEITLPENDSIKNGHNKDKSRVVQVHDESNRSPYWAFYVHPAWADTRIEIVQIVSEEKSL